MRAAVCSGDEKLREEIRRILSGLRLFRRIETYGAAFEVADAAERGEPFDYVILESDGPEVGRMLGCAQELYRQSPDTKILLVTEDGNQMLEEVFLMEANITAVFRKPVTDRRFREVIREVVEKSPRRREEKLIFRRKGEIVVIPFRKIFYLESRGHTVSVHTEDGVDSYYGKIEALRERLPENFLQCHKSYLVNMDRIRRMEKGKVLLENNLGIPVSQAKYRDAKLRFEQYIRKTPEYLYLEEENRGTAREQGLG